MKVIVYKWLFLSLLLFVTRNTSAQCPAGDFTAISGGAYVLDGNKTLIISSSVDNLKLTVSNSGNLICIAPGVTWTQETLTTFNGSVNINVYGIFDYNSIDNFNGNLASYINVQEGGSLNTNITEIGSNLLINNQGTTTFTSEKIVRFNDSFALYNFGANSKLIATKPEKVIFGSNTTICNWGNMEYTSLENADAMRFKNEASGIINIGRYFYNQGSFLNEGEINTRCGEFGKSACEFIISNKGTGKEFENKGCMFINGNTTISGAAYNNGTITITEGNLTIEKQLSGVGGSIVVLNGNSIIKSEGGYAGTNMFFWDENTIGHDFDEIGNNNPEATAYKVVKRSCKEEAAFGSIGDYVWNDANRDGQQGTSESPVSGMKVQLFKFISGKWASQISAVTDKNGKYLFDNLGSGNYKVQFLLPSSGQSFFTYFKKSGLNLTEDSDANPGNSNFSDDITIDTSLPSGDVKRNNMTIDAGVYFGTTPLPVTLVSFKVSRENQAVNLSWISSQEVNSERFDIEHSTTGKTWQKIGTVAAAGESNTRAQYSFADSNPSDGENLYRLKMIDADETFGYSNIRGVNFEVSEFITIYPNPVADRLFLKVKDLAKIEKVQLFDFSGKSMIDDASTFTDGIDVKAIPSGLYAVRVTGSNGAESSFKVVINK